ncbi:hypothetical protein [Pelagimonas varians]|uniref:hypothetical protein n=1 Tax=Pelagimonas varians TaxID=696760 RepID=UPI0014750F07|nr:hypothetical protein [Pelagimonas varians]
MTRFRLSLCGLFTLAILIGSGALTFIALPYAIWKLTVWVDATNDSFGPWWPL